MIFCRDTVCNAISGYVICVIGIPLFRVWLDEGFRAQGPMDPLMVKLGSYKHLKVAY